MTSKLRLIHWSTDDAREWKSIVARCRCGEASTYASYSDGRRATLPGEPDLVERARAIYDHRKSRRRAFGDDAALFQEPAWDILLELYIFGTDGHGLASMSIAYAIGVPTSTTLRWIRSLHLRALVTTKTDDRDARIRRVQLTSKAMEFMAAYLEGL